MFYYALHTACTLADAFTTMHSSIYAQRLAGIHMLAKHANEKIVD
jgi:hypothetical protein